MKAWLLEMRPKLILIGSPSRSGSTILDLMLGTRPDALSLGEVYAHFRPWRVHHRNSRCGCGADPCPVRAKMVEVGESTFHAHLFDAFGKQLVVDSSKDLNWIVDSLRRARGYSAHAVLVYKDPVSLSHSHYKRGEDLMTWRSQYDYYRSFLQLDVPFVSIRFNGLLQDPAAGVKRLCQALEIDYLPGQEHFWTGDHHHFFGSGVRKMLTAENPRIEDTEEFSAEFIRLIPEIEAAVKKDAGLAELLNELERRDVLVREPRRLTLPPNPQPTVPRWYYRRMLRQWYDRIFPARLRPATWRSGGTRR